MSLTNGETRFDVVVIGGGPAGSTAALILTREGLKVLVVEREEFPRFHIGESLLPRNTELFEELGLSEQLRSIPHTEKLGVEIALGHESVSSLFSFADCLGSMQAKAMNVERAPFDNLLLYEAEKAGAEIRRGAAVRELQKLGDGDCRVVVDGQVITAKYIVDASGQASLLGKHLGSRKEIVEMRKVSYFGHFTGVERRDGPLAGYPSLVMMEDSWFWIIPIDSHRTSVGVVMGRRYAQQVGLPPDQMLKWAIPRCPVMAQRMARAQPMDSFHTAADYSYRCEPFAGEGYFLVGDAATFLDPVFSTGVCLAMVGASQAANYLVSIIRDGASPGRMRRRYIKSLNRSSSLLFRFVRNYYSHSFRELLLREVGPLGIHKAIVSILAGNVFPRPSFSLLWRLWLFEVFFRVQGFIPIAPRRERFGLVENPVTPSSGAV